MTEPALWLLSLQAFAAVAVLLTLLTVAVQALTWLFRVQPDTAPAASPSTPTPGSGARANGRSGVASDAALVAAVHAAIQRVRPGARVVRIEEVPSRGPS